jgi:NitT/TauT family transport system ATP-binding protein
VTEHLYRVESVGVRLAGARPVLHDITFDVAAGEIVAIVGRTGVGKTTLLRVLGGLIEADCGTVLFDGRLVKGPPDGVVVVFQDYGNALLPWRTVARNAALGLEGRLGRGERGVRVESALRMVGLEEHGSDHPWQSVLAIANTAV